MAQAGGHGALSHSASMLPRNGPRLEKLLHFRESPLKPLCREVSHGAAWACECLGCLQPAQCPLAREAAFHARDSDLFLIWRSEHPSSGTAVCSKLNSAPNSSIEGGKTLSSGVGVTESSFLNRRTKSAWS